MKVLLFSTKFYNYMISLARSIGERKETEVLLVLPHDHPLNTDSEIKNNFPDNISCYFFKMPRFRSPKNIFTLIEILKLIRKYDPDIIHIQHNGHLYLHLLYPFLRKYPIVDTIHDPVPHVGEVNLRNAISLFFSLRNSCRFIVHGNKMKERLVTFFNIEREKIDVTFLGGDVQRYSGVLLNQKEEFEEKENTILFFGRIWKYKGLDYLIKSEPMISKKIENAKIVIAGRGENINKYTKLIKNNKKFKIINKFITGEEINQLFQECSLVVLPYIGASQSSIIPLAYSYGKPVVITNVGSLSEYAINGKTGLVVPSMNEESLARAIIILLNNPSLRRQMGLNALEFLDTHLSWGKIARQTVETYGKCMVKII